MSDQMYDAYVDLAAQSGWGACAECGQWFDLKLGVVVDGWYYHPACAPVAGRSQVLCAAAVLQPTWYAQRTGWQDIVRLSLLHLEFYRFVEAHPLLGSVEVAWSAFWAETPANPAVLRPAVAKFAEAEKLTLLEALSVLQSGAVQLEAAGRSPALAELTISCLAQLKRDYIKVSRPDLARFVEE